MRPDIDIESLFKNIRRKDIDPTRVEACQERLLKHFAKLDAEVEASTRKPIKKYFVYATVCALIIGIVTSSVFFYKAQITIAREKTREIVQKEYQNQNVFSLFINLFSQKSVVLLNDRKIQFDLRTNKMIKESLPITVSLNEKEEELVKKILTKNRIMYQIFSPSDEISMLTNFVIIFNNEPMSDSEWEKYDPEKGQYVDLNRLVIFCSTDPIVKITGFKYSDSKTKYAIVEIQPSRIYPSKKFKNFKTYLFVNLDIQKILGPDYKEERQFIRED